MRKLMILILVLSCFFGSKAYASMSEYCATPPFLSRKVAPNVMIVLDNSGSMFNFAYDYNRSGVSSGFNPNSEYYGYFDSNFWYKYESGKFVPTASKSSRNKYSNEWDGNFLNWLTMRRVDIARKVLVGGKYSGGYLIGEMADWYSRGYVKKVNNAENYTPYSGTKYFDFDLGGSGTSRFRVCSSCSCNWSSYYKCYICSCSDCSGYFNVKLSVDEEPEGIVQRTSNKVRWGLSFYHVNWPLSFPANYDRTQGGYVQVPIAGSSIEDMINEINNKNPDSNTPLAETLWTVAGYFAQRSSMLGGPGPRYHNGDYQINNNVDPYNYGTGGSPIWAWCAKSFVIYITDGEPCGDDNLPDELENYATNHGGYSYRGGLPSCSAGGNNTWIEDVALYVHTNDLRNDLKGTQTLTIYPVFAFGSGSELLKDVAINGGFVDKNGNNKPDLQSEWDEDGDGVPDNYFEAENGAELEAALEKILTDILRQASSGTAASVPATNEESGAVILQALFYPEKYFDKGTSVDWIGNLQSLWFYLGPFVQNIREDTDRDYILDLKNDYIVEYFFDNSTNKTRAHVWKDANGDGVPDEELEDRDISDIKFLWETGKVLFDTEPSKRKIFTYIDNSKVDFSVSNKDRLKNYLDADNSSYAEKIIKYIRGEDLTGYRNRTVTIGGKTAVWKLGDMIDSTPKIVSGSPLNSYQDNPPYGYGDLTYKRYVESNIYKNRGMVFVGANDGMLHAFRVGRVTILGGLNRIARLEKYPETYELGSEAWAFIPKNALPYLKYYMDPSYCHLYYVDLTPYVFDASICAPGEHENDYAEQEKTGDSSTWRTILIGGMRFGGACGNKSIDAIKPPNDSGNVPSGVGLSSYFAIDVTDPENPTVLWEFSDNNTAFTTTGPSIIHIPAKKFENGKENDDHKKNGYWYVVFASGPDNYDGTVHQPLYLYVLDLKTGKLKHKWQLSGDNCTSSDTLTCQTDLIGKYNAFAGRMFESSIDIGTNYKETYYSDDGMYFGYTYKDNGGNWKGGVIRVITNDDPNVKNWKITKLIDDIGPVTSGVKVLEDRNNENLWVYFGEGRYFSREDDISAQRRIYGIKDPCYDSAKERFKESCETTLSSSELMDVTNNGNADTSSSKGWYINLDKENVSYGAERVITDPVVVSYGWVLYTTFSPTNDICGFGGHTDLWLVNYDNGGTPNSPSGSVYLQVSTGAIPKIDLSEEFGEGKGRNYGRKMKGHIEGAPPVGSKPTITLLPEPLPVHIIHWREK